MWFELLLLLTIQFFFIIRSPFSACEEFREGRAKQCRLGTTNPEAGETLITARISNKVDNK